MKNPRQLASRKLKILELSASLPGPVILNAWPGNGRRSFEFPRSSMPASAEVSEKKERLGNTIGGVNDFTNFGL